MAVFEKVKEVIARECSVPESKVTEFAHLYLDLQIDSLGFYELMPALEDEFEVEIPYDDQEKLVIVGGIVRYIEEHSVLVAA